MPEANKNIVGDAKQALPLLFWLQLIVALVVLLSGCAAQSSGQQTHQPAESQNTAPGGEREQASGGESKLGHPVLGDPGAPVVMVEYGDFQ